MNYAFKMIAVPLVILSSCTPVGEVIKKNQLLVQIDNSISSDAELCQYKKLREGKTSLYRNDLNLLIKELKRRGVTPEKCVELTGDRGIYAEVNLKTKTYTHNKSIISSENKTKSRFVYYKDISKISDSRVCSISKNKNFYNYVFYQEEAKRRGLGCVVKDNNKTVIDSIRNKNNLYKGLFNNVDICDKATTPDLKWETHQDLLEFVNEAKRRGLDCGVNENATVIASTSSSKSPISSAELEAERQKRIELERKLIVLQSKQKQEQQRISSDNQEPIINAFSKQNGSNAIISGRVTDNIEIAEVLVDGQVQVLKPNGTFETDFYVPRSGKTIEIVAYDTKGNKASKLLKIERGNIQQASGPKFDALNPLGKRVKSNPNALALIIGVANYEKTSANALYADKDAQQFYDYATMKLGIPSSNIKELVNDKADLGEIGLAVQDWIARSTKKDKTDIYIFFAGHGLASDDGKDLYLLPYDGRPRLLDKTALLRDELFKEIQQSNPRSVTVFLDTCYSGTTRGTDMLIASRPIAIRALEQSIPNNFTVFSAAAGDQTSKPLEEAKHGMFSYFLMKGMEGDADSNNDNKITARELHAYVEQNVVQQSSGSQTPELQGDKDRVLVQFN